MLPVGSNFAPPLGPHSLHCALKFPVKPQSSRAVRCEPCMAQLALEGGSCVTRCVTSQHVAGQGQVAFSVSEVNTLCSACVFKCLIITVG